MTHNWAEDDDALLAALDNALAAGRTVPADFVAAGKVCFAWHGVDAELAQLVHDSILDANQPATRAETAVVRALTFVARNLTVEIEISGDGLHGQLIPHQNGTVTLELPGNEKVTTTADALGYFVINSVPTTSFRLHCHTATGTTVSTTWVKCNES